jgi:environmental stress-induced protein Ves
MSLTWKLIRKQELIISRWSGGTRTQFAIYPETSNYEAQNFKWRISTASIDVEESQFTLLPGYHRELIVLEGRLLLEHEGHHSCILQTFEQDSFEGGWNTRSQGMAKDFNITFSIECYGKLKVFTIKSGELLNQESPLEKIEKMNHEQRCRAFYCTNGELKMVWGDEEPVVLKAGDLLLLSESTRFPETTIEISNLTNKEVRLLETRIDYSP